MGESPPAGPGAVGRMGTASLTERVDLGTRGARRDSDAMRESLSRLSQMKRVMARANTPGASLAAAAAVAPVASAPPQRARASDAGDFGSAPLSVGVVRQAYRRRSKAEEKATHDRHTKNAALRTYSTARSPEKESTARPPSYYTARLPENAVDERASPRAFGDAADAPWAAFTDDDIDGPLVIDGLAYDEVSVGSGSAMKMALFTDRIEAELRARRPVRRRPGHGRGHRWASCDGRCSLIFDARSLQVLSRNRFCLNSKSAGAPRRSVLRQRRRRVQLPPRPPDSLRGVPSGPRGNNSAAAPSARRRRRRPNRAKGSEAANVIIGAPWPESRGVGTPAPLPRLRVAFFSCRACAFRFGATHRGFSRRCRQLRQVPRTIRTRRYTTPAESTSLSYDIPEPRRLVAARRRDARAVGRESAAQKALGVPLERFQQRARRDVPEPRRIVAARGRDARAVGRESAAQDLAGVPLERRRQRARLGVPEPRRLVVARRDEALAVGRERAARDGAGVPLERQQQRARLGVPKPRRLVAAHRRDALAVGRERAAEDVACVALERQQKRARLGVPDPRRVVVARRHDALAVGREGAARDAAGVPLEDCGALGNAVLPDELAQGQRHGARVAGDALRQKEAVGRGHQQEDGREQVALLKHAQ
ncbi:hypothetical protein M885DRAFT_275420 [Pelagophyceae sp. CCMP2097]|nr:hypothetical protein M885DRAFT_275420 [Pelagophyceae sp. CCMP2097]